jgi:hypothetical protein
LPIFGGSGVCAAFGVSAAGFESGFVSAVGVGADDSVLQQADSNNPAPTASTYVRRIIGDLR